MSRLSEAAKYAIAGALFGVSFPIGSIIFFIIVGQVSSAQPLTALVLDAHLNPHRYLLFVIDSAPLFLGVFAYLAGVRQDRIIGLSRGLEAQVAEKTESLQRALTEARTANEMISHMAHHDALTGLLNRRSFQKELERWSSHALRYERNLALVFLDVDKFKPINDDLGHHVGDAYLIALAGVLSKALRNTDYLARWGGDEFAILLPETDVAAARDVASKILRLFNETPVVVASETISPAASLGIAVCPEHATTADALVTHADVAMYEAKLAGGNTWRVYSATPEQVRRAQEETQWERRIRRALETDQFVLFYQPLLRLADRQTQDYEALLRMEDSKGGLLGPNLFLDHAERHGLSVPIDRMVIRKVGNKLAHLPDGHDLRLSLNLSAQTLADPLLPGYIEQMLRQSQVEPARLGIEIAETAIVEQLAVARNIGDALRTLGCRLIVDDFGSAFASLPYLQPLGVNLIKLQAGLSRDLAEDDAKRHLLGTIVAMAHDLNVQVAAKFIEDSSLLPLLSELGIDYAQGFAVGRPIESLDKSIVA